MISTLLAVSALAASGGGTQKPITMCEVAANPGTFMGREIVIRAEIATDGMERSVIFDPSCKGRRGIGLGLALDTNALEPISSRLDPQSSDNHDQLIASFQGKIVREKANKAAFYNDDGYRFAVRRVFDVKTK